MRIKRQLLGQFFVGVCALWIAAGVASAQSFQGGVRGSVKDAQGVIPGVTVTLANEATGVARDTVSNASGEYSFPAVDPSSYTVKAAVQGFKTFERKGIRIGTQQFVTLDIQLEVGTVEESITVTADAPLIETSNASHGEVLDAKTIESLPTIGRNVFLMAVTVADRAEQRRHALEPHAGSDRRLIALGRRRRRPCQQLPARWLSDHRPAEPLDHQSQPGDGRRRARAGAHL